MGLKVILNIFNRKDDKFLNIYSMFVVVFLYQLLFIFQGFDATDFGYHMTHQVLSFTLSPDIKYIEPMYFMSDFVGGMWLSLVGRPSVLWARIGGVLLEALNAAIIYSILGNHFKKREVFFVVFATSIFVSIFPGIYIHYYTFPAFLINIALWTLDKVVSSNTWSNKNYAYSFCLGFLVIPIILSRLPLVLIFIVPIFFYIYYYMKKRPYYLKEITLSAVMGIFFSMLCFGLLYWHLGILKYYFLYITEILVSSAGNDTNKIDSSYSLIKLIGSYIIDYIIIIIKLLILILGVYVLSIVKEKFGEKILNMLLIFISVLIVLRIVFLLKYDIIFTFADPFISEFVGIVILLSTIYFKFNKTKNENIDLLLISSLAVMVINPIGSNNGLFKAYYGMWLALPLSLLCISKIKINVNNVRISSMLSLVPKLFIFMIFLSILFQITYIYRDDTNRLNLNTEFSDPSLKGIYSTSSRVEVVDELIHQIKKYSDKNDEILIVNNMPVFYYLTETKPSFGNPWPDTLPLAEMKEKQLELGDKKELPKLFIYGKVNGADDRWSNVVDDDSSHIEKLNYLKIQYIKNLNYTILWENKAFAIYGRPSKNGSVSDVL